MARARAIKGYVVDLRPYVAAKCKAKREIHGNTDGLEFVEFFVFDAQLMRVSVNRTEIVWLAKQVNRCSIVAAGRC